MESDSENILDDESCAKVSLQYLYLANMFFIKNPCHPD